MLITKQFTTKHCCTPPHLYDEEYGSLAKQLGISVEVIVISLLQMGLVNQPDYNNYRQLKQSQRRLAESTQEQQEPIPRSYRYREPLNIFGDNYVRTVLNAHYAGLATLRKTSNYLDGLKITDIKKLQKAF